MSSRSVKRPWSVGQRPAPALPRRGRAIPTSPRAPPARRRECPNRCDGTNNGKIVSAAAPLGHAHRDRSRFARRKHERALLSVCLRDCPRPAREGGVRARGGGDASSPNRGDPFDPERSGDTRRGPGDGRSAGRGCPAGERRTPRGLAWSPRHHQGLHRDRGDPHYRRHHRAREARAGARCAGGRAAPRGRRDRARQDQYPGADSRRRKRQPDLRPNQQPVSPGSDSGREQRRGGRHHRGGRGGAGLGQRRGRQHPRAGALLRHRRNQADHRTRARHRTHPRELRCV